jgi:hypothetical protein
MTAGFVAACVHSWQPIWSVEPWVPEAVEADGRLPRPT